MYPMNSEQYWEIVIEGFLVDIFFCQKTCFALEFFLLELLWSRTQHFNFLSKIKFDFSEKLEEKSKEDIHQDIEHTAPQHR